MVHSSLCNLSSAETKYQKPITNVFETRINPARPENIVLLHGTSASVHTWNGRVEALEDNYCVVRMDLPAFGLTGPYNNPDKRYNMDNYVNTVISVMDQTNIKGDLILIESAYKFDQAIPNSELVIFKDLGHVPQEEDPVATVETVKQFLNKTKTK